MKSAGNPWQAIVTISDQRHLWEDRLFSREYNKHRKTNKIDEVVKKKAGDLSNATNTTRFNREGYAPYTLKKAGVYKHTNATTINASNATKWTSLDVVRNILEVELGLEEGTGIGKYSLEKFFEDNKVEIENLIFEMSGLPGALQQVLNSARATIFQHPDGHIIIEGVDNERGINSLLSNFQTMDGSGWPIPQDLRRVRPGRVRVMFPKIHEIKFKYEETTVSGGTFDPSVLDFGLENVLQIPDTFEATVDKVKKKYIKGQWVPIKEALAAWNAQDDRPFKGKATLNLRGVRVSWFSDQLKYRFASRFTNRDLFDLIWEPRMQAVERSYRQIFRILPKWMDRIRSWEPVRVAVNDPLTGNRAPSPVFLNYCKIPSFRLPLYKKGYGGKHKGGYNVLNYSSNTNTANPAPFLLSPINQSLGVFRIDYASDPLSLISSTIPSKVDDIPVLSANSSPSDILWHGASLSPSHNMDVILSVVFAEPNDEERHFILDYKMKEGEVKKTADLPVRMESARYEWQDTTSAFLKEDRVTIHGEKLVNADMLQAIGDASAKEFAANWKNQTVGVFTQPGYESDWLPNGSIRSVTIRFSARRGLETTFNLSERAKRQSLFDLLPPTVRRVIYKQLDLE